MTVRIGVVSDPHFCAESDKGSERSSHLIIPSKESSSDPLNSLISGLQENSALQDVFGVDILICPGDITCYANKDALVHGWRELNRLSKAIGAASLTGTVGNHDVESRPDPNGFFAAPVDHLKLLDPPFPISTNADSTIEYWGRGFAEVRDRVKKLRVITLNSCEYHATGLSKEFNRGRIGEPALKWLKEHLQKEPTGADWVDALVCHHHPIQHGMYGLGEHDLMIGGEALCSVLASTKKQWLVIHGHKHHSRIAQASSGAYYAPWVFAASSFAAMLDAKFASISSNQFFIVEASRNTDGSLQGLVRSWTWTHGFGWERSTDDNKGLVDRSGFGYRGSPIELAARIAAHVKNSSAGYLKWNEICNLEPDVRFLLQDDVKAMIAKLSELVEVIATERTLFPAHLMKK